MSDLETGLNIFEGKFGKIKNIKFLLADGMDIEAVGAEFLAIAQETAAGTVGLHESYPEPDLRS